MEWIVTDAESGLKLIDFLKSKQVSSSSRQIKKAIESNACTINGRTERFASSPVGIGDKIDFNWIEKTTNSGAVLFEDENLFIYDKPSGVSSEDPKFIQNLEKTALTPLYLLHRLDKETSGVLLFAKTLKMQEKMLNLFKQRKIRKTYYAVIDGIPTKDFGIIDNYLGKLHVYQGQTLWGAVDSDKGLHARTEWRVMQKGKDAALLECRPITGRTHQIRVHCSGMGHPILGDYQYGRKFRCSVRPPRCLLHAFEVIFIDPIKDSEVHVRAPLPKDMEQALESMRKKDNYENIDH